MKQKWLFFLFLILFLGQTTPSWAILEAPKQAQVRAAVEKPKAAPPDNLKRQKTYLAIAATLAVVGVLLFAFGYSSFIALMAAALAATVSLIFWLILAFMN